MGGGGSAGEGLGEGEGAGDISSTLPCTAQPHGASPCRDFAQFTCIGGYLLCFGDENKGPEGGRCRQEGTRSWATGLGSVSA